MLYGHGVKFPIYFLYERQVQCLCNAPYFDSPFKFNSCSIVFDGILCFDLINSIDYNTISNLIAGFITYSISSKNIMLSNIKNPTEYTVVDYMCNTP